MKAVFLTFFLFFSACHSYSVYRPEIRYTEAEINLVFDSSGFRGINGWVWQLGTLCYAYDRYDWWSIQGWKEQVDILEEWSYILGENKNPPPRNPYHARK